VGIGFLVVFPFRPEAGPLSSIWRFVSKAFARRGRDAETAGVCVDRCVKSLTGRGSALSVPLCEARHLAEQRADVRGFVTARKFAVQPRDGEPD
jgi:hypothetical protein